MFFFFLQTKFNIYLHETVIIFLMPCIVGTLRSKHDLVTSILYYVRILYYRLNQNAKRSFVRIIVDRARPLRRAAQIRGGSMINTENDRNLIFVRIKKKKTFDREKLRGSYY